MESSQPPSGEEYASNHGSRGRAIIIINDTFTPTTGMSYRKGADLDKANLVNTFEQLGFNVTAETNLTWKETNILLEQASKEDHSDSDCFVCVIASHGDWALMGLDAQRDDIDQIISDVIYATDDVIPTRNLTSLFTNRNCPSLANKPKLFFIQACRGEDVSAAASVPDTASEATPSTGKDKSEPMEVDGKSPTVNQSDSENSKSEGASGDSGDHSKQKEGLEQKEGPEESTTDETEGHWTMVAGGAMEHVQLPFDVPIFQDFLLACATQPGNLSFRIPKLGSPFVYFLCQELNEHYKDMDLASILTRVNLKVAYEYQSNMPSNPGLHHRKQMPWVASRLTKDVRFHPKPN